ncbi:MAG: SDR family NAD(P)-dependent oxidoreductase [Planctomycetota bacterium]
MNAIFPHVGPRHPSPSEPEIQPVAIIGVGCRLPGGCDDAESYWRLLSEGHSAISETPADRWSLRKFYAAGESRPGRTQSRHGGFVSGIDRFDPKLFGISPREASWMDPQQRMLLESAYRAIEDGGVPVEAIAGRSVSVHVGISSFDYAVAGLSFRDRGVIGPYSNTGGSSSIAANRVSYCFDLRGESVAVDTACSSSLIATHLACRSLQDPANEMALAGGVNALLLPDFYVAFSQLGVLSPDGRCKTFDAAANGYVRSEGAGMILMKRLGDAVRDGDRIYAVIRGSATNQDGRTEGMTVPSQAAQQTLMKSAIRNAGIQPTDVNYVEAHGTGTPVGDPIEAAAIGECYGRPDERECYLASVKTNVGHLEAGAGIASVIKVALALRHRVLPAHLHLETLNPKIDFASSGLTVPRETCSWHSNTTRHAAINGFGYGGANAHLILSEYETTETPHSRSPVSIRSARAPSDSVACLPLSAHSESSLVESAASWADWLDDQHESLEDIAGSAARHRSHHAWRTMVFGKTKREWIAQLRRLSAGSAPSDTVTLAPTIRRVDASAQKANLRGNGELAFVCSGQGPQWWAMGRGMLTTGRVFRETIQRADREFAKYVSWSLVEELSRGEQDSRMQQTSIAQPCLFALQVALAAEWRAHGVRPTILVGHSVGEIAAAHLSGALGFSDACCVAVHRGRTMDAASSKGAMIAVGLTRDEVEPRLKHFGERVSIAAINGPASLTLSGAADDIEQLQHEFDRQGAFCRRLQVEYAFHSAQMDPVRDELLRVLSGIEPRPTKTPMISTVTGRPIRGEELDGQYWWKNVRQGVLFADAMSVLAERDVAFAIELGPHPVLAYAMAECFGSYQKTLETVPSLHRKQVDADQFAWSLSKLYGWGYNVDWGAVHPGTPKRYEFPKLVMSRDSLWSESFDSATSRSESHWDAVLGDRVDGMANVWQQRVDLALHSRFADHRVRNSCVFPAAGMLTLALAAARRMGQASTSQSLQHSEPTTECIPLRSFRLQSPCLFDQDRPIHLETRYAQDRNRLTLASRAVDESEWQPIATIDWSSERATEPLPFEEAKPADDHENLQTVSHDQLYRHCRDLGLHYGEGFRGVREAKRDDHEAWIRFELPSTESGFRDPLSDMAAVLDSCFHGMIVADPDFNDSDGGLYLPQRIESLDSWDAHEVRSGFARVTITHKDQYRMIADLDLYDSDDRPFAAIRGFESVRVAGTGRQSSIDGLLYQLIWKPSEPPAQPVEPVVNPRKWIVFTDQCGLAADIEPDLPPADRVIKVQHGAGFKRLHEDSFIIDPECEQHFHRLLADVGDGVTDIVYCWGLDGPDNVELSAEVLEKSSQLTTVAPLHLVRSWQTASESGGQQQVARLAIVTLQSQPLPKEQSPLSLAAAPLIGFGRVIVSECASLKTKLIDLSDDTASQRRGLLGDLLEHHDDEDEILYQDEIRWVRRFVAVSEHPGPVQAAPKHRSVLRRGESAAIQQLRFESSPHAELADHEIEMEVVAAGLNFSDVMKALDLYPGLPDGPPILGAECSGRVSRVGRSVSRFRIGEEVFGVAPGGFASHVVVDERLVAAKPKSLSHQEAAAIPIAFLTADHALHHCARMQSRDRVLIHAASGGVGIAAMQLAKLAGVTFFGTAGTDEKRDYVLRAGAARVMNSRDLRFASETLEETNGEGIDIVLNSLPGEAIAKGISILRTGGRFLEIGKRDIYNDAPLGMEPFRNNLAFFAIDLDQLIREQPAVIGQRLGSLVPRFESGELKPLPVKSFDATEVRDAFRFMQQAQHIGKVVVDFQASLTDVFLGESDPFRAKADRSYWIAGGLGGFGFRVAQWLAERGAKHLVLGGRSGRVNADSMPALDRLREQGVDVKILPVDLTDAVSVTRAAEQIEREGPALAGVFHTAMVLEDRLIADLDRETLERVLRPKVQGGWNLHAATEDLDLEQFVLFSSLSSVFGHAGQANYSAANSLLDSLGHYRRSIGMPATVINWGHVGNVGYLSRRGELSQRLERQGVLTFSDDEAMQCLDRAIGTDAIQWSVLRMDWTVWRGLGITGNVSPRFAGLLQGKRQSNASDRVVTPADIRDAGGDERMTMISELVGKKVATLLGIEPERMPWDQPLLSLGLDSLMAVEMRNWVENQLQIDLPIATLMRGNGLEEICQTIACAFGSADEKESKQTTTADAEPNETAELLDRLSEMSDDDVDALLSEMMNDNQSESTGG